MSLETNEQERQTKNINSNRVKRKNGKAKLNATQRKYKLRLQKKDKKQSCDLAKRGSCQGRLLNFWCRKLDNYSQRTREEEQLGLGWGSYVKSVRSVLNGHVWGSFDIYK